MNGRRDSLFKGADEGNIEEAGCGGVTSSPSNTTNLSGNDYVEVTATGELRSLSKRGETSSSSLDKHASLKRKSSKGGTAPVKEETDHRPYDNLAARDKKASPGHHYDNLLGAKGDISTTKVGIEEDHRKMVNTKVRKSAGEAVGEESDFLEFFDNMDQKKGSLPSLAR